MAEASGQVARGSTSSMVEPSYGASGPRAWPSPARRLDFGVSSPAEQLSSDRGLATMSNSGVGGSPPFRGGESGVDLVECKLREWRQSLETRRASGLPSRQPLDQPALSGESADEDAASSVSCSQELAASLARSSRGAGMPCLDYAPRVPRLGAQSAHLAGHPSPAASRATTHRMTPPTQRSLQFGSVTTIRTEAASLARAPSAHEDAWPSSPLARPGANPRPSEPKSLQTSGLGGPGSPSKPVMGAPFPGGSPGRLGTPSVKSSTNLEETFADGWAANATLHEAGESESGASAGVIDLTFTKPIAACREPLRSPDRPTASCSSTRSSLAGFGKPESQCTGESGAENMKSGGDITSEALSQPSVAARPPRVVAEVASTMATPRLAGAGFQVGASAGHLSQPSMAAIGSKAGSRDAESRGSPPCPRSRTSSFTPPGSPSEPASASRPPSKCSGATPPPTSEPCLPAHFDAGWMHSGASRLGVGRGDGPDSRAHAGSIQEQREGLLRSYSFGLEGRKQPAQQPVALPSCGLGGPGGLGGLAGHFRQQGRGSGPFEASIAESAGMSSPGGLRTPDSWGLHDPNNFSPDHEVQGQFASQPSATRPDNSRSLPQDVDSPVSVGEMQGPIPDADTSIQRLEAIKRVLEEREAQLLSLMEQEPLSARRGSRLAEAQRAESQEAHSWRNSLPLFDTQADARHHMPCPKPQLAVCPEPPSGRHDAALVEERSARSDVHNAWHDSSEPHVGPTYEVRRFLLWDPLSPDRDTLHTGMQLAMPRVTPSDRHDPSHSGMREQERCDLEDEDLEASRLARAIAEVDTYIADLEAQLRQADVDMISIDLSASGIGGIEVLSDISTAASMPQPPHIYEALWHEKAHALERELRSEAAAAAEVQDRIQWLRVQLQHLPGHQDERVVEIRALLVEVADRVRDSARSAALCVSTSRLHYRVAGLAL